MVREAVFGPVRTADGVARTLWVGLLSSGVVLVASSLRGWPFHTLTTGPWAYQYAAPPPLKWLFLLVFLLGVVGLCAAWVRLLRLAAAGAVTLRSAWLATALWSLPLCFGVPLFSGDVYVYWVDGQAMVRGYSIYEAGVSAMGPDAMVHMVHPIWRNATTMYGPVFMRLAEGVARIGGDNLVAGVLIFRGLTVAAVGLTGVAVVDLARRFGRSPSAALVFAVGNPLTVLHLVGGVHNDALMLGLLLAGLAVGMRRSWLWRALALLLCVVAAAIKVPAFAGVLVLGWIWAASAEPRGSGRTEHEGGLVWWGKGGRPWRRIAGASLAGIVSGAAFAGVTALTGLGWGWLGATDVPGRAHPLLSPPNALALSFGSVFDVGTGLNAVTRALGTLVAITAGSWLVMRTGRHGSPAQVLRAAGWALLVVAWLGPAVYPWYLVWGVTIIGTFGAGRLRRPLVASIVITSFLVAPGGYGWLDLWSDWRRTVTAFLVVGVMTSVVSAVVRQNGSEGELAGAAHRSAEISKTPPRATV